MSIFGRRNRRSGGDETREQRRIEGSLGAEDDYPVDNAGYHDSYGDDDYGADNYGADHPDYTDENENYADEDYAQPRYPAELNEPYEGPFDAEDAPDDELARLDLGSVRIPLPPDARVHVRTEPPRAVHVLTRNARFTVAAYAAPRSSNGLWSNVSRELADQLHNDGARVRKEQGEWGIELVALVNDMLLRFVGIDGPRWLLRGVAEGPKEHSASAAEELRTMVRGTVVVRGRQPMPARAALPVTLPSEIAEDIERFRTGEG